MPESFVPAFKDQELSPEVRDGRREAAKARARAKKVAASAIHRQCRVYNDQLDAFATLLRVPLDTSDVDLRARTAWSAIWPVACRSLSLGKALISLVEAGYCVEAFPTARSIFETNRLLWVFCDERGTDLTKQWLDGKPPTPSKIKSTLRRWEIADVEAGGETIPGPTSDELHGQLYSILSETGHTSRESTSRSISFSLREVVIGPTPDYAMRAYYVSWAGHVVWEILHTAGLAIALGFGEDLHQEFVAPALEQVKAFNNLDHVPAGFERSTPAEFQ